MHFEPFGMKEFHKIQDGIVFPLNGGDSYCQHVYILQQYANGTRRNKTICKVSRVLFQ